MRKLFYPDKVVVVGVSPSPDNLAKNILRNLLKFKFPGEVYAVGNKEGEVYGKRVYASVLDLPADVDMAAILIPARFVPRVLDECGQKGVRRAVISSGGFAEFDEAGRGLQLQLEAVARKRGIRFLGPNCIGITNLHNGLVVPFSPQNPELTVKGSNSVIAQSGGVAMRSGSLFSEAGLGFNKVISIGNKLNIDEVDLLEFLIDDSETRVIFMYLEDIRRGQDLLRVARKSTKPIVVLKSNVNPATADIARSHTAAIAASDDRVVDGALRQAGVVRVRSLEQFITAAKAFALPRIQGDNIVVISPSGGFAVMSADIAGGLGFRLPRLPEHVVKHLETRSRAGVIKFTNPVDFGDVYDRRATVDVVTELLKLPEVSAMAVTVPTGGGASGMGFTGPDAEKLLMDIRDASFSIGKPVAAAVFAGEDQLPKMIKQARFPLFRTIEEAIQALAIQRDYWRNKEALGSL